MKVFPTAELEHRVGTVQAGLRRDGIDAAIFLQNVDLYYLSGTIQQSHLVVPAEGEPLLLVRRDLNRALSESALPTIRGMEGVRDLPEALRAAGIAPRRASAWSSTCCRWPTTCATAAFFRRPPSQTARPPYGKPVR